MKKVVIIFILALIALYVLLSLVTSGDEYAAERLFYKAIQAYREVMTNPEVIPAGVMVSAVNKFKLVYEKYPESETAGKAHLTLAEFYMAAKDHDGAMKTLNAFIDNAYDDITLMSKAYFYRAAVYEAQKKWDEALDEYQILRDKYFETTVGILVPLNSARVYSMKNDTPKTAAAYKEAVIFYEQMEKRNRQTLAGYAAADLLRQTYMEVGKIEAAGMVVEETLKNYPHPNTYQKYLPLVEYIYIEQLNRPEKAIQIFNNILETAQDERFKTFLRQRIDVFGAKTQE